MRRAWALVALGAAVLCGCAGDQEVKRWAGQWLAHEGAGLRGEPGSPEALAQVARAAPTRADRDMARFGQARALRAQGRDREAFGLFTSLADTAMRRMDRARARYETARMAESAGKRGEALRLFRHVVETYPRQPAALRSMQHLEHIVTEGGVPAQVASLRWSRSVYGALAKTPIGDDLAFLAAQTVYGWWRRAGGDVLAARAEAMLRRVDEHHYPSGHWDNALWMLSRLFHTQGRYDDEIWALGRIFSTRETALIVGHYDTTYHWVGQLRIARLQLLEFDAPDKAASTYDSFVSSFHYSRWRDDARFWQGCALLRAGKPEAAEEAFADIAEVYAESKYLARLGEARGDPHGSVCTPKEFEEDSW